MEEYGRVAMEGEGRMALLFGRDKEGLEREVRDRVDGCIMERKWWQELVYMMAEVPMNLDPKLNPPPPTHPPLQQSVFIMVAILFIHFYTHFPISLCYIIPATMLM